MSTFVAWSDSILGPSTGWAEIFLTHVLGYNAFSAVEIDTVNSAYNEIAKVEQSDKQTIQKDVI